MPSWHTLEFPETVDLGSGKCVRWGMKPTEPCPEGGEWVLVRAPKWALDEIA